jgi:hypothetical protein
VYVLAALNNGTALTYTSVATSLRAAAARSSTTWSRTGQGIGCRGVAELTSPANHPLRAYAVGSESPCALFRYRHRSAFGQVNVTVTGTLVERELRRPSQAFSPVRIDHHAVAVDAPWAGVVSGFSAGPPTT